MIVERGSLSEENWKKLTDNLDKEFEEEESETTSQTWSVQFPVKGYGGEPEVEEDDLTGAVFDAVRSAFSDQEIEPPQKIE